MKQSGFALIESILLAFLAISAGCAIYFTWLYKVPEIVQPQKAKELDNEVRVFTKPLQIKAYSGRVKKKFHLPPSPETIKVVDAVKLEKDCGTAIVTLDELTGEVSTAIRKDPKPWLARESTTEIRLDAGFKGLKQVYRLSATQDVIRVKDFHIGLTVAAYSDGDVFAGVGVGWRF